MDTEIDIDDRDPEEIRREAEREELYAIEDRVVRELSRICGGRQFVQLHRAATGSVYLTITADDGADAVVRIANHMECYPPRYGVSLQMTVGPAHADGVSEEKAVAAIERWYAAHSESDE